MAGWMGLDDSAKMYYGGSRLCPSRAGLVTGNLHERSSERGRSYRPTDHKDLILLMQAELKGWVTQNYQ